MKPLNKFRWALLGLCLTASMSGYATATDADIDAARTNLNNARLTYNTELSKLKQQYGYGNLTRTQYLNQIKLAKTKFDSNRNRIQLVLYKQMKSISVSPS